MTVRVGVLGTSWWADSMYLPALTNNPEVDVVGVCGRNPERAAEFAATWNVPNWATDPDAFLDPDALDAVIVATSNDSHEHLTMLALERGLHVLCEKPIATNLEGANRMADKAAATGGITLVPFTYRYMPTFQFVKELVDDGFVGRPHHLNLRYYTGFARDTAYNWRFDDDLAGSGVLGDIGSHWLHVARWLLGEVVSIGCVSERFVPKDDRPDGTPYERGEDFAQMTVRFQSGAIGTLLVSAVCWEGTDFGQSHHLDLHGTDGTIYSLNDWSSVQEVRGLKAEETGPPPLLEIPDHIWGEARRDRVHDTYRDVFRVNQWMIGEWITAVAEGRQCEPDLREGARVQELLEVAVQSAKDGGRMIDV